jgi:SAM-dependent methyltransferase
MRAHLREIVEAVQLLHITPLSNVLDIGCNDGTLLNSYTKAVNRVGIDPSNSMPSSDQAILYIKDFFPSAELKARIGAAKFDIITSIAMFYDLEDPLSFTREVKNLLADNGIWVVEVSYMPKMILQGSYDSICHEHLEYYSFAVLEKLFAKAQLHVFRGEFNNMNGGSIRLFVTHDHCFNYKNEENLLFLRKIRINEFDLELDADRVYQRFQERAEHQRDELKKLLKNLKTDGKKIHLYGASTKGNTILQWCAIDGRTVDFAADRNPDKWGALTPGSEIPIVSEESSRAMCPDYYLVMPWHFKEEFLERERDMIIKGTKFIFPLPTVEIIGN